MSSLAHSHIPAHVCAYRGAHVQSKRVRCQHINAQIATQLEIQSEMLSVAMRASQWNAVVWTLGFTETHPTGGFRLLSETYTNAL